MTQDPDILKIAQMRAFSLLSSHNSSLLSPWRISAKYTHYLGKEHSITISSEGWNTERADVKRYRNWYITELAFGYNLGVGCFDKWHVREVNQMQLCTCISLGYTKMVPLKN
jgi:hypothetical protein